MTSLKFKRVYLLELVIAVTISLGIGSILGMKVFSHLYTLSGIQARTDMHLNKRMNFLEKKIRACEDKHQGDKALKPVSL